MEYGGKWERTIEAGSGRKSLRKPKLSYKGEGSKAPLLDADIIHLEKETCWRGKNEGIDLK